MKHARKLIAVILTLVMTAALCVSAFANTPETYTLTVPSTDSHTYEVYQIFTGDYKAGTAGATGILSNLKWGQNAKNGSSPVTSGQAVPTDVIDALTSDSLGTSDREKLAVILTYADLTGTPYVSALTNAAPKTDVPAGYYLLKDVSSADLSHDAYSTYIVQVVDNVTVLRKAAMPTVDKQVRDEVADAEKINGTATDPAGWGETADHNIMESYKYKLLATLPSDDDDIDAYSTYKLVFNDAMSAGITFEKIDSVTVIIPATSSTNEQRIPVGKDGDTNVTNGYVCTATENQPNSTWTLTIADLKQHTGSSSLKGVQVEVIYSAHLNANCTVSDPGDSSLTDANKNSVSLTYSNNPNAQASTGETLQDHVWVFTYKMPNTKYHTAASAGNELANAGFKLQNAEGKWATMTSGKITGWVASIEQATEITSAASTGKFDIIGLDAGVYTLTESTVPSGYNKCNDLTITISANHTEDAATHSSANVAMSITGTGISNNRVDVVNKSGVVLPETGGIGTTVFYVLGGVLMVGAAILLITKKRMSDDDK